MTNRIHFVEFEDEIFFGAERDDGAHTLDEVIVSLSPRVQSVLKDRGKCINSLYFLKKDDYKHILETSSRILKDAEDAFSYCDCIEVSHAYKTALLFYLKFYVHYWLVNLHIISSAIKHYKPSSISFTLSPSSCKGLGLNIEKNEKMLGQVIKSFLNSSSLNIKTEINYTGCISTRTKPFSSFKWIAAFGLLKLYRVFKPKRPVILAASDRYNLRALVGLISESRNLFPVYYRSGRKWHENLFSLMKGREWFFISRKFSLKTHGRSPLDKAIDQAKESIRELDPKKYTFCEVDLRDVVCHFLSSRARYGLHKLQKEISDLNRLISAVRPDVVLSQYALGDTYALGEICLKNNIPSLLISHGTHALQKEDNLAAIEWLDHSKTILNAHYSYTAIQSPMADNFFDSIRQKNTNSLQTGPLIYSKFEYGNMTLKLKLKERLIGAVNSNKRIVLHAGTPKGRSSMRLWVHETIDEYIRNVNDLINAVDLLEDVYLVIRFRESEDLKRSDFFRLINSSPNCGVYIDGQFADYLSISDLLISYSSTTIEEALQNNVPVLQYDHDDKYMHIEAPTVDFQSFCINPIYYCGNSGDLSTTIKLILENLDLIKSDGRKWDAYQYPIDNKLLWLNRLLRYD